MKLPFLKTRRLPRIATEPTEEKLVNASGSDHVDDHCMGELFDAVQAKDVARFRSAVEALVLNLFDFEGDDNG
jgi:hypothetical protein